ncbi:MAG TPA: hypothetical protein VMZ28_10955 [Kofleriaceae bacterium]|nr:hypothetical protein [Kofleriaceae bacterium]
MRSPALLVLLLLAPGPARAELPPSAFVTTDGTQFRVGGKPFVFVGANLETLQGPHFRAHYQATLDAARADGLTVGRVWAFGEGASEADAASEQLFRTAPDRFVEASFVQLDRVLAAARARDLRLIITLGNHWNDYGGVAAYLAWAGLPTEGWGARDRFFSDPRTRAWFRAHAERLAGRVNTVTGVRYADDPTIFAWELFNESQVQTPDGAIARRAFIAEMAGAVKARDPHHLVTPGVIGYTTRAERAEWLSVCRLPEVDYCDSHLYPSGADRVFHEGELLAFIDDRVQLAHHVAKKPLVFGEFGFDTRSAEWLGRARAAWFGAFLERVFHDGAAGALVWIYQPWTGRPRDFGIYVDRPDTDDVRAVLRALAARVRDAVPEARNPRLSAANGDRMLYDPYRVAHGSGPARVRSEGGRLTVVLDPERFASGRFERVGTFGDGGALHAYGAGDGWFEWEFTVETPARARVGLSARLSSEFPGKTAPPDGGSDVNVLVDGVRAGRLRVIPDDGAGRPERLRLPRLRAGRHLLRLEVPPGPRAHGLCVYAE